MHVVMLPLILLQNWQGWVEDCVLMTKKALQYYIHMPRNTNYFHLTHHLLRPRDVEVTNVLLQIQPLSTSWGCLPHAAAREGNVKAKSGTKSGGERLSVSSSTSWRCCHNMFSLCQVHFCMWGGKKLQELLHDLFFVIVFFSSLSFYRGLWLQ